MDLTHTFTVPASVEDTWSAFNDIESVAGCFPGATVTSVEGEEFKGSCKVKLGPISLVYSGTGKFLERDESAHRFVIEAKGKDKRGNGTAGATVTAVMTSSSPGSTDVEVRTDLAITGKPAQFGRGVIQDVSDKLLQQFVDCLESKVGGADVADVEAAAGDTSTTAGDGSAAAASGPTRKAPASTYSGVSAGREPGEHAAHEPPPPTDGGALDLGATVFPILLRSYWKQLAAVVVGLLVLRRLVSRR
ncbi:MAG TPA: SRPBCC family protein [Nocardioidaceae bacterium]|nr:SRPBCC family protein [Nocardioidaceae bacterium]